MKALIVCTLCLVTAVKTSPPQQLQPKQFQIQHRSGGNSGGDGYRSAFFAVQSISTITSSETVTTTKYVRPTCMIIPAGLKPCPRARRGANLCDVDPSPVQTVEKTIAPRSLTKDDYQQYLRQHNQQQRQQFPELQSSQTAPGEFKITGFSDPTGSFDGLLRQQRSVERQLWTMFSRVTKTVKTTKSVTETLPLVPGLFVGFQVAGCIPNLNFPPCPANPPAKLLK